jgi:hypothetical protein
VNIKMEEDFWSADELVSPEENEMLQASFTEEEIKQAIDSSYAEGAWAGWVLLSVLSEILGGH